MLAMMKYMPSLAESPSQSDDSQEDHDHRIASNVSQDNTQIQIMRLL